jgi:hypothetical protein
MITSLLFRVHEYFAGLPNTILTAILLGLALAVAIIAILPKEYAVLKALAIAYVGLP